MSASERTPLLAPEHESGPATESSPLLSDNHRRNSQDGDWQNSMAIHHSDLNTGGSRGGGYGTGLRCSPAVKHYAEKAAVIEPTGLSLESLTPDGVRARIQANFRLDGARVNDNTARFLGRLATGIVRKIDTEETKVQVHLPRYGNALLGSAVVPPLTISLVDGHNTAMDFVANLSPGDSSIVRQIVNDWLDGKLEQLKVTGSAAIHVKSGVLPLGTHKVVESMVFEANDIPSIPDYDISQLNIHDVPVGDPGQSAIGANASITAYNDYPVSLAVPSLGFDILVPNCEPSESYIKVATAVTNPIDVQPHANVTADAIGLIRDIPEPLTRPCPLSDLSPLDNFIQQYLHGKSAKIFVRGQKTENSDVPDWVGSLLSTITVPIDLPGRSFDDAIRNISVSDINFKLPSPFADPNSPNGKPRVSGTLQVLAALPSELQLDIGINSLQAKSDVFYEGKKFGELNLRRWQKASSTKLPGSGDDEDLMQITARIANVPLDITDGDVFSDVMQELLFGDDDLVLDINSLVDAKVSTVIGDLVLKDIPAKGKIPVKHLPGKSFLDLDPHVGDIVIVETSENSVKMRASINLTNPTPYTASIPYANVHVMVKGHLIGEVTAKDLDLKLGENTNMVVYATWDPVTWGGEESHKVATQLLSNYLSGKNTSLTMKAHRGSIPAVPVIGEALSKINITLPTPRVKLPDDESGEGQSHRFVRDASFHFFSSTASFNLASPLRVNTVHIERINATAFYNHTEPVGEILYEEAFDAPPGVTETPRLPVEWSLGSIGFDKLKAALGGTLKLDASAEATLRIGNWRETVHYEGRGIGARIRL
ncbi:hypothetical protein PT974_02397 [Cladobotryum mycophilum]|uniref:Uncharacterized protein n=1 Tax=Cladobotryum mycophilum TaxID=491253 RepID=A0ABR0SXY7_9HYPO